MLRERIAGGGVRPLSARVAPCSHNSSIIIRAVLFKRPRKLPFCVRQHGAGGFINRRIKNDRCRAAFFSSREFRLLLQRDIPGGGGSGVTAPIPKLSARAVQNKNYYCVHRPAFYLMGVFVR